MLKSEIATRVTFHDNTITTAVKYMAFSVVDLPAPKIPVWEFDLWFAGLDPAVTVLPICQDAMAKHIAVYTTMKSLMNALRAGDQVLATNLFSTLQAEVTQFQSTMETWEAITI